MKSAVLLGLLTLPFTVFGQGTPAPKRLTGQGYYLNLASGMQLRDSAHYTYSGQHASRFDPHNLRYTDLQQLGSAPDADALLDEVPTNNIDSSMLPRAAYDSAYFDLSIGQAAPFALRTYEGHRYNADSSIAAVYQRATDPGTGSQLYGQHSIEIYSSGRHTRSYIFSYDGVGYDTGYIRDYRYNAAGQLLLDSVSWRVTPGNYIGFQKLVYTYGAARGHQSLTRYKFVPGPSRLEPAFLDSLAYYPGGQLQRRKYFRMSTSGNFVPEYLDSFGYTGGVAGHTYLREQLLDTLGNVEYTYFTIADRINARGLKDSVTVLGFRGTVPLSNTRIGIVYDTAGDPLRRNLYYSSTGVAPYSVEHYYYEPVPQINTGIPTTAAVTVDLYPNPSSGPLSYRLEGLKPGSSITVEVYSTAGQLVHRERMQWPGGAQPLVLGSEAPPGTYFLRIATEHAGTVSSRQFTRL